MCWTASAAVLAGPRLRRTGDGSTGRRRARCCPSRRSRGSRPERAQPPDLHDILRTMSALKVDRALVLHVAKLASLSLSDADTDRLASELARIVEYVEQLDELDTSDVPPTAHVALDHTPLREDEPRPGLSHDDALAQAPRTDLGGFAVPNFLE